MKNTDARVYFITLWTVLISMILITPAFAAKLDGKTIAQQGNNKGAVACIACHGQQGEGNAAAGYPYLAGLPQAYIEKQLHDFAGGSRDNAVMKPFASSLTDSEITAVATYYAGLKNPKLSASIANTSSSGDLGAELAKEGKWAQGVPACFKCHGENGKGVAPHFPPIVGQPAKYLRNQLASWQTGKRKNDPIGLMQAVTHSLTEEDIDAVAHFLSDQPKQ